ncbi:MAG: hybrid sensor histidine kinase/response regulator [Nitrospinota bacterium]|nr:hybrid sensor histidine kinase/response regulator [Nitrospinota bacterium]
MSKSLFGNEKVKILIADDTPANIDVLQKTLEPEGYSLSVVTDGKMVLEIIPRLNPDLILLDIMMPEMNGYEACQAIKENEETRDIPVIFISAKSEVEDIVEGFRAGGVDYLTKPIRREEVLARVKTHLQLSRLKKLQEKRIRELELQNEKLEELDRIKNTFLGTAMHDLRNPLASIRGFTDLFLMGKDSFTDDEKTEFMEIIHQTSQDLLSLVNDLLDISVFESGQLSLKLVSGNLNPLIQKKIQMSQIALDQKNIKVEALLDEVPDFTYDSNRIGQVIDNLLSNAIKFSQPGTSVQVGLLSNKKSLEFYIRDQGPGISPKDLPRLFTAFPKINNQPTGGEKSTGLGLSIVKKIVDAHSGTIHVESEVGQGATFHVRLPR